MVCNASLIAPDFWGEAEAANGAGCAGGCTRGSRSGRLRLDRASAGTHGVQNTAGMNTRPLIAQLVALAIFAAACFGQTVTEAQKMAIEKYPDLGRPGRPLHTKFLALHQDAGKNDPRLLADPNWPLILADRAWDLVYPLPEKSAKVKPSKVDVLLKAKAGAAFRIRNGEVTINGKLIKRVEIGDKTAIIYYFNKGVDDRRPKFRFRMINAYGMEIGEFRDEWTFKSIPAGAVRSENAEFFISNLTHELLEFSTIELPDDWKQPLFLVIEGSEP